MSFNKSLSNVSALVPFILLAFLYPIQSSAAVVVLGTTTLQCSPNIPKYAECIEQQQLQAQQQKQTVFKDQYSLGCQSYLDSHGGHGHSAIDSATFLCKTTCDSGYHLGDSNLCYQNPASIVQPTISGSATVLTRYSSGLTEQQVQAIVVLLQAFVADQSVVIQVQTALRGT